MSGGKKVVVINSQERAVSTDINRLQSFANAGEAELFRYLMNVSMATDDVDAAAVMTQNTTQGTPLLGEIVNGLMVRPQSGAGVLDVQIDPGLLYVLNPDGAPDDSNYKFVNDPGILTNGVLTMPANPGGSPVIAIIEVQPAAIISETDNRDIYNASTGLFSASTVTKAREMRAAGGGTLNTTFRVRAGTVGGGIPALAAGWLPLAVAFIPAAATANDQMTFWDVRPILGDREFAPFNLKRSVGTIARHTSQSSPNAGGTTTTVTGVVEGTFGGRRIGGRLRRGTPGSDAATGIIIGPGDLSNADPGLTFAANALRFLYLVFPAGLPRWARYQDGAAGRVPRSPRGIFVLSNVGPNPDGTPSAAVSLPTSTGLSGNTTNALCVGAYFVNAAGTQLVNMSSDGRRQVAAGTKNATAVGFATALQVPTLSAASSSTTSAKYNLVANTHFPANAKRLLVAAQAVLSVTSGNITYGNQFNAYYPGDANNVFWNSIAGSYTLPSAPPALNFADWVPTPPVDPVGGAAVAASGLNFTLEHLYSGSGTGFAASSLALAVIGWEF